MATDEHAQNKGWHSRGYLPHFDQRQLVQSITFRLDDSLPVHVRETLKDSDPQSRYYTVDKSLDTGYGPCWLSNLIVAGIVQDAFHYFDGQRYRLIAWVIMPNHVHCVIEQTESWSLGSIIASWKSFTAHTANRLLHRTGAFWADDYFDRFVRDMEHLQDVVNYIHYNPVKAGLCDVPEQWRWSSAYPEAPGARDGRGPAPDADADK